MLKTLLATTAAASLLAFGAVAQEAADPGQAPAEVVPADPATPAVPEAGTEPMTAPGGMEAAQEPAPGAAPLAPGATELGTVLTPADDTKISADTLIGAPMQTMDGENIATIEDVIVSADGGVENVVAQFGGFLGFGSNRVLLTMDEISVMQDEAGSFVVQTALTPESLEGRPDYEVEN